MIPGGIADKLGNRYEAKWLVRCLMDVIDGNKASWLNFESVDTEYQGFEFAIARDEITEWHQTKINAPGGNWTLNALKKEGVLKAFSNRLSTDKDAHCFFVSQDNAKGLRTLTEKARTANNYVQYAGILSKDQSDDFQQLQQEWSQPDEIIFDWLKRSYFELFPERELDSWNESFGDFYFHHGGKAAFPVLRDILENHFNKPLTTKAARQAVQSQGTLVFKAWAIDPTIQERLCEETNAYLQTYTPFGAGGETIARVQSSNLIEEILNQNGPELILLTGVAGSGKSGVIRSAIEKLRECTIPHLAFRVDQYLTCGTREELGNKLIGREESPVSTLKGTFPNSTSVLFIDQVDAISEVSGRDGQVKEVIFRLITDAHNFGGIKIVVVCRTFDLDSDPRLKNLKEKNRTKQIDVPLLDWTNDVEPLLKNKGIDVSTFKEPQRLLLSVPVNLAVFLEIDDPNITFHSRSNLHENLIKKKQRIISQGRQIGWPLIKPLTTMCDWMTERQKLSAPDSVLDDYPNAVDILSSEGLIISSRGQINFFHESFFDHIYARSFVSRKLSLIVLLTATEQHLFRRTQVRQILESLRQNDMERYLKELSSVLFSDDARFHIKSAICQWLNSVDNPTEAEFQIISQFDEPCDRFHQLFRYAVLSTAWFDFLNTKGWIRQELEGENQERVEEALRWLANIAGEHPKEIAELLRLWWGGDSKRGNRLLNWFGFVSRNKPDDDLLLLCEKVIKSHPEELINTPAHDRIEMLLHTWGEKSPERCSQILHALFEAWFNLNQDVNPFAKNEIEPMIGHSLNEIANKAPYAFLLGATDTLVRTIETALKDREAGKNDYEFNYRIYSGYRSGFDEFLGLYRAALIQVLQQTPSLTNSFLDKLNPFKHETFMHLHLEAIQANPTILAGRLPEYAANPMIFDAGFNGADWWSFAHACREAFPVLNSQGKEVIEQVILNHNPEIQWNIRNLADINQHGETEPFWTKKGVIRNLKYSRMQQWFILETISEKLLTLKASTRLHELRRKFAGEKIPTPTCNNEIASYVGSPINQTQCENMNDSHWLAAIKRYNNNEEARRGRNVDGGGASELAHQLHEATKKHPNRFAELSLKIPDNAPTSYINRILSALAETETASDESLIQTVKRADRHPDKPFGRAIAQLIQKHPKIAADAEILDLLIWYAINGEASEDENLDRQNTKRETITIDNLISRGGSLYIRGINGTRGWMWEALGSVLWEVPDATLRVWDALDSALEKEPLISVRCCMMKPLTPLFNTDKSRFCESIRKLIILPDGLSTDSHSMRLSPLISRQGIYLFPYIFNSLPELANELVTELFECVDETKQLIAAWLVFCESFRADTYLDRADELASVSIDHRRLFATVTADSISWTGNRYRAEALLKEFFFDEDELTRKHSANAFSKISGVDVEKYRELISIFITSPAFPGHSYAVLHMLENATCDVLDLVISVSERLVMDANQDRRRAIDSYHLESIIKKEYTSSESNTEARKKILDLIDLMMSTEMYGVDNIVAAHDRW